MLKKVTKVSPSLVPSGTLYSLADLGNGAFSLNTARLDRGKLKIIKSAGEPSSPYDPGIRFSGVVTSPSGKRAAFRGPASRYYIMSLKKGAGIPVRQGFGRGPLEHGDFKCRFTSFSPLERYLAYKYYLPPPAKGYGLGIYDAKPQQTWQQDNALLPVWSASGQHLVFIRHSFKGRYEGDLFYVNFLGRFLSEVLADIHFFAKDIRHLNQPGAERITFAQAVGLVGPWYRPLVSYSVKEQYGMFQERDLGPNQVAPDNRGVALINSHDIWAGTWPPLHSEDNAFVWTTQYLDRSGHAPIYKPAPPLSPILSWSRDGERVYGLTGTSTFEYFDDQDGYGRPLICFWVRTGKYALVPLPEKLGTPLTYIED